MQRLTNPDNPSGRIYLLLLVNPRPDMTATMFTPSPWQRGHYWMEIQGYSLAKVRDMIRRLVRETGSELGEIYPHRDGRSILYSYTLGEILSETPSGPPHASSEIPGEIPGEIQPAKSQAKSSQNPHKSHTKNTRRKSKMNQNSEKEEPCKR